MEIPKEYSNIIQESGIYIVYSIELCSAISIVGKRKKKILWNIKFDSLEIMMSNINYILSETKKQLAAGNS
jgi:hypothetical protein